jgi:hypothetical protein
MAKVTLLTSREICESFNLSVCYKVDYRDKYVEVFLPQGQDINKEYGIAAIIGKDVVEEIINGEGSNKEKVEKVAKKIKPYRKQMGQFNANVYCYFDPMDDSYYYLAWEYPYKEDEREAKYGYLNAILEMIFKDGKRKKSDIDFFNMYSHDQDFDIVYDGEDFDKNKTDDNDVNRDVFENLNLNEYIYLKKLFDDYIDNTPPKGRIKLFQHNASFQKIVNSFPSNILIT